MFVETQTSEMKNVADVMLRHSKHVRWASQTMH